MNRGLKILISIIVIAGAIACLYWIWQNRQTANLNNQGVKLIAAEQYGEAVKVLQEAARRDPSNPIVWRNLGKAYIAAGMEEKGAEAAAKAEELQNKGKTQQNAPGPDASGQ